MSTKSPAEVSAGLIIKALRAHVATLGGMGALAQASGLSRESLYKTLRPAGNPRLATLLRIVDALGLELQVEAVSPEPPKSDGL